MANVAARAGVSTPTVSRVLTGAAPVSPAKRAAVEAAIAELKFTPNAVARALATGQPRVIAVVAGNTSRYGYAETIRGIEETAREDGYTVMITVVESGEDAVVDHAMAATIAQPLAGVIALKFDSAGAAALRRVPPGTALVAISGARERSVSQAILDEAGAAEELTELLLAHGHRTVSHVRVPASRGEDGRTMGWRRALQNAGRPIPEVFEATWEPRSGEAIGRLIALDRSITAVLCGNDEIAMGVIRGLLVEGCTVPRDVSVVGFDDHPLAEMWSPPLTTAHQDFAGLGRRSFGLLKQQIEGVRDVQFSSARPTLVVRGSVGAPNTARGAAEPRDG
jgi:DNA-binding LacI/PurR family transcriptional regulator